MRPAEQGFLLLSSQLGNPERRPLTPTQLRVLAQRAALLPPPAEGRELDVSDLKALGYGGELAGRILGLLEERELLERYLHGGRKQDCFPLTRVSPGYPPEVRKRLGLDSPGCLWAKGDLSVLDGPKVSLVGSRELREDNRRFAEMLGRQAARQGFVLVSGNARGADRAAQESCLEAGGRVISVVADALQARRERKNVLFLSEEDYDAPFSTQRALSRNRVIHALGKAVFVAQCGPGTGGTWDGTVKNLRFGWSPVFCFDDGSEAAANLARMGAKMVGLGQLDDLNSLDIPQLSLFDQ